MGKVVEKNENDYVDVLEVADKDNIEECVCSRCGVSYKRVKGSKQKKTVCKKCFYDNRRKKNEKMQYTVENGIATFTTSSGIEFIVDEEDAERVVEYGWWVNDNGYIQGWVNGKTVRLHRFLMGLLESDKTLVVDHINHDKTNNCKCNLRICSHQENQRNKKDVKGIYKTSNGTYQAYIYVDGKKIHLGCYESEQMARAVRLIAEKEFFGNFSFNVDLFDDVETKRLYEEAIASRRKCKKKESKEAIVL